MDFGQKAPPSNKLVRILGVKETHAEVFKLQTEGCPGSSIPIASNRRGEKSFHFKQLDTEAQSYKTEISAWFCSVHSSLMTLLQSTVSEQNQVTKISAGDFNRSKIKPTAKRWGKMNRCSS